MTLADLRTAAELLPPGSSLMLSRESLLEALTDSSNATTQPTASVDPETWMTADECAAKLSVSARWCYDHAEILGARKLSRRCVRFSSRAVDRYLTRTRTRHV